MRRFVPISAPAGAKDDSPGRKPGVCAGHQEPRRGERNSNASYAPTGLDVSPLITHGLRRGLSSFAATRLLCHWQLAASVILAGLAIGCDDGSMTNNGRIKPHEPVQFFADGNSSRPLPEGTVSRDAAFPGTIPNDFPFAITRKDLVRGQERYNIYCSVCHGMTGNGDGIVQRRGFNKPSPASYHQDRLRQAPVGHFFDVVTNGWGAMPSYASQICVADRWKIIAYVRALQLSQGQSKTLAYEGPVEPVKGATK